MDTLKDIGSAVLEQLKQKFTPTIYELWFKSLQLVSLDGDTAVFSTDSNFKQDLIAKRHAGSIRDALREVVGFDVKVVIESREDSEGFHIPEIKDKPEEKKTVPLSSKRTKSWPPTLMPCIRGRGRILTARTGKRKPARIWGH